MRIPPGGMAGLPLIAAAAFFMQALDATILNTALPAIAESLGESPLAMQMTVVGYTLTVALLIPASGWFADRFGTRNVFLFAVALFALGSLSCALSGSLRMLVLSRVIQGIGGAMMMPVARLAVLRAFPREKLVAVLNFISIPGLVGPVVGPLLGGALVTYVGWHWIFLINIPVGLAGMLYAWRIMPQFTGTHGPFDFTGFAFFGLGLAFFSGGLELFGSRAESKSLAPFLLLAGVALLALYARHARRSKAPLIRLGVFRIHTFRVGIAGNVVSRLGTGCMPYLMPLMLQVGLGHPALTAGMMMAPMALGSLTAKNVCRARAAPLRLPQHSGGRHRLHRPDDRPVLAPDSLPAPLDADPAHDPAGHGHVHAVHGHEQHYPGGSRPGACQHGQQPARRHPAAFDQLRRGQQHGGAAPVQRPGAGVTAGSFS